MHGRLVATVATPAGAGLSSDDVVRAMPAFFGPADRAPQVARTDVVLAVVGPSHDPQQSLQQARVLTIVTAAVLRHRATAYSGRLPIP
jgi:hypothetical protein